MARARARKTESHSDTATVESTHEPDVFDEAIAARQQEQSEIERQAEQRAATAHIANPSSTARPANGHTAALTRRQHNLPDKLTVSAGDMKVQLIDKGDNMAGIGIRVVFPEGRKPTDEEKAIIRRHVKGEDGEQTGFAWQGDLGMWHKDIARHGEHPADIPSSRAVAIRLDAESRVVKLAESLREHSADPVGYAEMVKARREQAANSERIPD